MHFQIYYKAKYVVAEEVKRQFDQPDICIIRDIESLLLRSANEGGTTEISQEIIEFLSGNVSIERLKVQLAMLTVRKVTNIRTITDAMLKSSIYQNMMCELDKLLLLYLTIPVTREIFLKLT